MGETEYGTDLDRIEEICVEVTDLDPSVASASATGDEIRVREDAVSTYACSAAPDA